MQWCFKTINHLNAEISPTIFQMLDTSRHPSWRDFVTLELPQGRSVNLKPYTINYKP